MASPEKKHAPASEIAAPKAASQGADAEHDEDAEDLEVFRAMQQISLRTSAKELEKLIGPA